MNNFRFNGYCNIQQGIPGSTNKVAEILEELVGGIDELTTKGLLPEGDIEGLERAAGKAELFLRPQSMEPAPWIGELADAQFNQLTPAQSERLDILAEECAEVIQAIMKIKRHGLQSCSPFGANPETNGEALLRELVDVGAAIGMLHLDLPLLADEQYMDGALDKALRKKLAYCHHQGQDFEEYLDVVEAL